MEVSYLGYGLTPQGITQGINKLKVLDNARPLNNVHEVNKSVQLLQGTCPKLCTDPTCLDAERLPLEDSFQRTQNNSDLQTVGPLSSARSSLRLHHSTDACHGDAKKPRGYYAPFLFGNVSFNLGRIVYLQGKHFVLYTDHKSLVSFGTSHIKKLNQMREAMNT